MAQDTHLFLDWNEEEANVIEQQDGRSFEVGRVTLRTLTGIIVGCIYYHYLLPMAIVRQEGRGAGSAYQRILQHLRTLHIIYPEIAADQLRQRSSKFLELAIPIQFPVPFHPTDPYAQTVLDRITPYIHSLGTTHLFEILRIREF